METDHEAVKQVINDFLNFGKGIITADGTAQRLSQMAQTKNARRQLEKYDIVQSAFISYLRECTEFGKCGIRWPEKKMKISELNELLAGAYKPALTSRYPWARQLFL